MYQSQITPWLWQWKRDCKNKIWESGHALWQWLFYSHDLSGRKSINITSRNTILVTYCYERLRTYQNHFAVITRQQNRLTVIQLLMVSSSPSLARSIICNQKCYFSCSRNTEIQRCPELKEDTFMGTWKWGQIVQFPGGGGRRFCKTTQFKGMYEAEWNFQRGVGGDLDKIPSAYSSLPHFPSNICYSTSTVHSL